MVLQDRVVAVIFMCLTAVLMSIIAAVTFYENQKLNYAMTNGYEQIVYPGTETPVWVLSEKKSDEHNKAVAP